MFIIPLITLLAIISLVILFIQRGKSHVNEHVHSKKILQISVPLQNQKTPLAAEQMFQSLHGILRKNKKSKYLYSFEIFANENGIYFIIVAEENYLNFIMNQVYAQYPDAHINTVRDYCEFFNKDIPIIGSEIGLENDIMFPIKTFDNFEVDPLASITGTLSKLPPKFMASIQLIVRPIDNSWQKRGNKYIDKFYKREPDTPSTPIPTEEKIRFEQIHQKNNKVGFQFIIRVIVQGPEPHVSQSLLHDIEASFKQFQTPNLNSLTIKQDTNTLFTRLNGNNQLSLFYKYRQRYLDKNTKDILNISELASLYHLPNESVQTPNIIWARSKKLEYPADLPKKDCRFLGFTDYRNIHIPFGIKKEDRRKHTYLLGKTGTGKSTLLKKMIVGDILDGEGVGVVDPHGDLVEEILEHIPEDRIKDVVYLDPSDIDHPIALNMLDIKESETIDLLADGIVSVFKKFFGHSWGPRLQYILTNTILTLLHCQNVSLLAVQRILIDKNYRKFLLKQVDADPFLQKFWNEEFEEMSKNKRLLTEAISPIQNKVGRFLSSPMVRNMVGQVTSKIDLEDIMNDQKILLINLSQGKIGEENSSLLGAMIVTRLYSNAMQRANMSTNERNDFYLYVDEFQNFATETFVKILSEARKYGLNLTVTHQYIDQISEEIQRAIFGNVGTLMNFVVGPQDAKRLEQEYSPHLTAEDLVNLDKFRLTMKMSIDNSQSKPFTAATTMPDYPKFNLTNIIKDYNRENYSTPKEVIEAKLKKWAKQKYNSEGNLVQ
jgi:hypothetical protein